MSRELAYVYKLYAGVVPGSYGIDIGLE